jgi:hypothetical protein
MAGYSRTPLTKKLGIRPGTTIYVRGVPGDYEGLLDPLPERVRIVSRMTRSVDIAHVFADRRARLKRAMTSIRARMKPNAAIWVSWPKKSSKVPSDLGEAAIREIALPMGLVDVKICAVNDTWYGLKLVVRRELPEFG